MQPLLSVKSTSGCVHKRVNCVHIPLYVSDFIHKVIVGMPNTGSDV